MAKLELLNKASHSDLRVITARGKEFGDAVSGSLVFPGEFVEVHKEYPIYFQKEEQTGEFQAVVLFGFSREENLFLNRDKWAANYLPVLMQKEPFYIGFQEKPDGEKVPVIHIDIESPRVSRGQSGERLFLDSGENSQFLNRAAAMLTAIHEGLTASRTMFDVWAEHDLIEQFTLDIIFDDNSQFKTSNYYTINQQKLMALGNESLGMMHKAGYLQLAYFVLASLGNIKHLIARKNELAGVSS